MFFKLISDLNYLLYKCVYTRKEQNQKYLVVYYSKLIKPSITLF